MAVDCRPLHARIAAALGWPESDVLSFNLQSLREILRGSNGDSALITEITERIQSGSYIIGDSVDHSHHPRG
jgi:hypothetical protein